MSEIEDRLKKLKPKNVSPNLEEKIERAMHARTIRPFFRIVAAAAVLILMFLAAFLIKGLRTQDTEDIVTYKTEDRHSLHFYIYDKNRDVLLDVVVPRETVQLTVSETF